MSTTTADTHAAIERGCAFLLDRQLPSGELPACVSSDFEDDGAWRYDPTAFATAVVASCMASVPGSDAALVVQRAAGFLRARMHPPGVWRFAADRMEVR